MSAPPYMKFFWGDYHKATRHLTRDQHGAYFLLIGEAWRLGGSLPDDDRLLAAWALCSPSEWAEMKDIITGFFTLRRGKWVHDRVREELAHYEDVSRKRKSAGKRGGSVKPGKNEGNSEAIASQEHTKPEPEPEEDIEPPISPKGDETPPSKTIILRQAHVEAAWSVTSRKGRARSSKADIQAALQAAARRGKAPEDVIAGLAAYYASPEATKDGGEFAKGAHRIIANDRWESFVETVTPLEVIAASAPADPNEVWRKRVKAYLHGSGFWNTTDWEAQPGRPGCRVPAEVLREFGVEVAGQMAGAAA